MSCCNRCGPNVACSCNSQCCGNATGTSCGNPFFTCNPACAEDHTEKTVINCLSASIRISNPWNIPECGQTAIIVVPGLKQILIGSQIWNPNYGYFEVTAFDQASGQVTIINGCDELNASPGTAVPACTEFIVTAGPCACPDSTDACVAIDFTAPDVDDCIDITLTSTEGITAGDTVQIGTGFYFVDEVKPNDIITICNEGQGIAPGTPVIAKDANDQYQYCLSIISSNPCDRTAEMEGPVMVCGDNGIAPLQNTGAGRVPMLLDNLDNDAAYRPLDAAVPVCSTVTVILNITAGVSGPYTLNLVSSVGMTIGDSLIVGFRTDRFVVTNVPNGTQVTGNFTSVPGPGEVVAVGELVCQVGCCERIQDDLDCVVQGTRLAITPALYGQAITMATPGGGTAAQVYEVTLDSNVIEFEAPDDCPGSTYNVRAELQVTGLVDMDPFASGGEPAILSCEVQADWDNNPGVGGRFNWTESGNDGVDISGIYPPSSLNAMWATLQITNNTYPITYHGAYVIADTVVASGVTVTLRLNFKAIEGENIPSTAVRSVGVYIIGNLIISKIT